MDGNPATVWFFLWMVTERKKRGKLKSYTASKEMKTWQRSCQKPQNKLENIVREGIAYYDVWEDCLYFLSSTTRRYFKELLLPLHSLPPFPKHDKQMKEPSEGRCRLLSLSTSPHPNTSLLRSSPTTWLESAPLPPCLLRTEPRSRHAVKGSNLLVDIVPLFKFQ